METKQIEVYQYNELDEKAKERARNWYLEASAGDCFEWDCIKDDAKTVGLRLDGTHRGSMEGDFIESAIECANSVLKEHGESCETYSTAKNFLKERAEIESAAVRDEGGIVDETTYDNLIYACEKEFLRSILEDYRVMADKQEEYIQSEEYIAECTEANEYEFTKEGKRI